MDKTEIRTSQVTVKSEYLVGGIWKPLKTDLVLLTGIRLCRRKISSDTGEFIPGVYRVNPYEVLNDEVTLRSVTKVINVTYYGTMYRFTYTGELDSSIIAILPNPEIPASIAYLKKEALQKAYSKLGSASFGIGADLGELRETIQMLRSPLSSFRKFLLGKPRQDTGYNNLGRLRDLLFYNRAGTFRSWTGRNAVKAATDTWLELRYGFRPLIGSIGTVVEAIQEKNDKLFNPNRIRTCRSTRRTSLSKTKDGMYVPSWPGTGSGSYTTESEYTIHACVQYTQSREYTMVEKLGLTPQYWPETAWELTKLSFVWDWFVSIGPWIESFRFKPEITVLGNTVGTRVSEKTRTHNILLRTGYGDYNNPTPAPPCSFRTREWYKREINVDQPNFPVFRCGDVFDLAKTVDSMALIIQSLNKALNKH